MVFFYIVKTLNVKMSFLNVLPLVLVNVARTAAAMSIAVIHKSVAVAYYILSGMHIYK